MKKNLELRLAGSGGQGVILSSIILAEAALADHKYAVQSQSYGPEARGGLCKAEVIIGQMEIDFPKVESPDILLALTQASLDQYCLGAQPNCLIIADSSLKKPEGDTHIISLPILQTASDVVKNPMTANIVALGAINTLAHLVDDTLLENAVLKYVPKHTQAVNRLALAEGRKIARAQISTYH